MTYTIKWKPEGDHNQLLTVNNMTPEMTQTFVAKLIADCLCVYIGVIKEDN